MRKGTLLVAASVVGSMFCLTQDSVAQEQELRGFVLEHRVAVFTCNAGRHARGRLRANTEIRNDELFVWFEGNGESKTNGVVLEVRDSRGRTVDTLEASNIPSYQKVRVHNVQRGLQYRVTHTFGDSAAANRCTNVVQ